MILVTICEGLVTYCHFPGFVLPPYDHLPDAVIADKWAEMLTSLVDSGNGAWKGLVSETYVDGHGSTASDANSKRHVLRFFEANFPGV
jgi:hypothetical protein